MPDINIDDAEEDNSNDSFSGKQAPLIEIESTQSKSRVYVDSDSDDQYDDNDLPSALGLEDQQQLNDQIIDQQVKLYQKLFQQEYENADNDDAESDQSHALQVVNVVDDFSSIQNSDDGEKKEKLFGHIKPNRKAKIDL